MGRPPIGVDVLLGVRVPAELVEKPEEWAADHGICKSEAVRRLLVKGLSK